MVVRLGVLPSEFWQLDPTEVKLIIDEHYNLHMIRKTGMDVETLDRLLEASKKTVIKNG
ncbi:hypothetical protein [Oceanospirillum phage vB_OliS_GJ44]|nr:hypothetical protein [Oceanospirillum phage vB_OliS_GJ44]